MSKNQMEYCTSDWIGSVLVCHGHKRNECDKFLTQK